MVLASTTPRFAIIYHYKDTCLLSVVEGLPDQLLAQLPQPRRTVLVKSVRFCILSWCKLAVLEVHAVVI